jgi:hypothetical protein
VSAQVGFLNAELQRWDLLLRESGARPEALGLTVFEDERPLRGAAGLCDWRLGGRLSRLLGTGAGAAHFQGRRGEQLLLPTGPRLPFSRIVLYGLGRVETFDEVAARVATRELLRALRKVAPQPDPRALTPAEPPTLALVPPGRSTGALSARRALELVLDEVDAELGDPSAARVVVLESAAGQKEAGELVRARQQQSGPTTLTP